MISFFVPGKPVGKQRPRLGGDKVFTPKKTKLYEKLVGDLAIVARNKEGKYAPWLEKVFVHVGVQARNTVRPDIDNICKSILDGMNKIIYFDDKQVRALSYREEINAEGVDGVLVMVGELNELEKINTEK